MRPYKYPENPFLYFLSPNDLVVRVMGPVGPDHDRKTLKRSTTHETTRGDAKRKRHIRSVRNGRKRYVTNGNWYITKIRLVMTDDRYVTKQRIMTNGNGS